MDKKKLEIINLILGTEVNVSKDDIHPETTNKIKDIIQQGITEKNALSNIITPEKLKKCFDLLYSNTKKQIYTSSLDLLKTSETNNLSTLILKLNLYIKSREDLWVIKKKKDDTLTTYILIPKS